jgi:anti-sigma factor RsiW
MEEQTRRSQGGNDARHIHPGDEVLSAYLDTARGGLDSEVRAQTAAHLDTCADCRESLHELMALRAMLHALPQAEPRRSFILTPELAAAGGPRRNWQAPRWLWPTRWATVAAAVIFALTIGFGARPQTNAVTVSTAATTTTTLATAPVAASTSTLCSSDPLTQDCLLIAGLTPTIFPTPTAITVPQQAPTSTATAATDWRPVQLLSGGFTLIGGLYGFVFPAFRRRDQKFAA